jgi:cell division protease FtsH
MTYPVESATTSSSQKPATSTLFATNRPTFADDHLSELLSKGAVVTAKPVSTGSNPLLTILGGVLPTVLLVGFWVWIIQRYWGQMRKGGGMFGMGRSKAHKYEATTERTTFADVAGIDDAKDELAEVVDYPRQPDRYRRLGAGIPLMACC